ncbi:MAG: cupin domain-containing protein [Betaproteobacteria bacterium]|nr:cupin domain-containing protein [Betaproteobacteria bacterium]
MMSKATQDMSPIEKRQYHDQAEAKIAIFKFEAPPPNARPKQVKFLVKTDVLGIALQVVKEGGENNLHYHTSMDEGWMVVKGRARFYGQGGKLLSELAPLEGVFIPAGARYRFEKAGEETLEILQMIGFDRAAPEKPNRVNVEETKDWMVEDIFKKNDAAMAKI